MSEYIKKEEEIECLEAMKRANMNFDDRYIYAKVIQQVKDMPPADVVEVVRCKDCIRNADNGGLYDDGRTKCPIQEHYALLKDGFCHLGERKEQEHE